MKRAKILSSGTSVPKMVVDSLDLAETSGSNYNWVLENLGSASRRFAAEGELTSDLAARAAKTALKAADIPIDDVQLIILATATPDQHAPASACKVQDILGARNAFAFDLNAVCSGTMYALNIATNFIKSGEVEKAVVIGADTFSHFIDLDRRDACFFGDGAGAIVLSPSSNGEGFRNFELCSDPVGFDAFRIEYGLKSLKGLSSEKFYEMDGAEIFSSAMKILPNFLNRFLDKNNTSLDDIDLIISHQPSKVLLSSILNELRFDESKAVFNFEHFANTGSATVAMACAAAMEDLRFQQANKILFFSIGAGWTWGAGLYEKS